MSEGAGGDSRPIFRARTAITLVLVGVVAFSAFVTLLAYAPDLDRDGHCRSNVYSRCAIGFAECRRTYEAFAFPGAWA